jgi:hypothetical protein
MAMGSVEGISLGQRLFDGFESVRSSERVGRSRPSCSRQPPALPGTEDRRRETNAERSRRRAFEGQGLSPDDPE